MSHTILYHCTSCNRAWDKKEFFVEHAQKRGHTKSQVVKIPTHKWEELKKQFPEEDEI